MFKAGLTGGIGSGKSVVARIFEVLGVPVFHADDEGKRLLQEDAEVKRQVIAAFGGSCYPDGLLDRQRLAGIVFNNGEALATLNGIVHPAVRERFRLWCSDQQAPYVVMEAAILVESGGHQAFDHLVVVNAPEAVRLERVMKRDGASEEAVRARMRNQADEEVRTAIADTVLVNDGDTLLVPQVLALHERLTQLASR